VETVTINGEKVQVNPALERFPNRSAKGSAMWAPVMSDGRVRVTATLWFEPEHRQCSPIRPVIERFSGLAVRGEPAWIFVEDAGEDFSYALAGMVTENLLSGLEWRKR
jgi:hypothetical protein